MNYKVKIADRVFNVQITDLNSRPVIANVDGVEIEVWPEEGEVVQAAARPQAPTVRPEPASVKQSPPSKLATPPTNGASTSKQVLAPIPGVVVSVAVLPGAEVTAGQELCVLEAMKMKNVIRSTRSGRIASIYVQNGQHVKHHDVLMDFAE